MSQISPPIRILLIAVIGLVAVYMLFLRPKTEEAAPVAAAPVATTVPAKDPGAATSSGSGQIVQNAVKRTTDASAQAKVAAGEAPGGLAADGTTAATGAGTTAATATGAAGTQSGAPAPITKETLAGLPADVRRAVRKHKVIAMLFYNNRSADDRAVRRALAKVDHYGGQVFIDAHWIKSVSRYQAIARGVEVEQSPTIVVADRNLKAESLVGYVDSQTIDQAVVDAIRASGGSVLGNPYFRKLDTICASTELQVKALPKPVATAGVAAYLTGAQALAAGMVKQVAAVKPPAKLKRFHKRFKSYTADSTAIVTTAAADAKAHPAAAVKTATAKGRALDKKFIAKNGAHGLSCF
ncbi:MAG: hypothetical protein ABI611_13830 [Solirubrobacteraceae bacterium]